MMLYSKWELSFQQAKVCEQYLSTKYFAQNLKKHGIDIYRWGRYQSIDATNIDLIDIASIDMQH